MNINIYFSYQKDDITICFTLMGSSDVLDWVREFVCLLLETFGNFWKKAGEFEFGIEIEFGLTLSTNCNYQLFSPNGWRWEMLALLITGEISLPNFFWCVFMVWFSRADPVGNFPLNLSWDSLVDLFNFSFGHFFTFLYFLLFTFLLIPKIRIVIC